MQVLGQYLLSVTGAAVAGGIFRRLLPEKGTAGLIGKLLTGVFLALTVISPWTDIQLGQLEGLTLDISSQAAQAVADGEDRTNAALASVIKQECQAYILDKAQDLGLTLSVEVELSRDQIPVPVSVRLQGAAGPYAKSRLAQVLEEDLGIEKERQLWT